MAAIHVVGVRGDPCGAVRWTVQRTYNLLINLFHANRYQFSLGSALIWSSLQGQMPSTSLTCGHEEKITYGCVRPKPETFLMSFKFTADFAVLRKGTPYGSLTAATRDRSKRCSDMGRDVSVRIAIHYKLDIPGIESRWGQRFSATVQTGHGGHSRG